MISKFARIALATVCGLSLTALAQTNTAANSPAPAGPPNAPSAASPATGTKVGTINIEGAIFSSNEGRRDFETLSKKFEPKQAELKGVNDEIEGLKKQLTTQGEKMNEDAKNSLVKQIEGRQKSLERSMQDTREEFQSQQGEIAQRILAKMAPVIVKYSGENGFGVIIDTSQPWPQGPVVWYGQSVDITAPVVEAYNVQSGVAAPPAGTATRPPGGVKPTAPATKSAAPATAPATKPAAPATKPPASTTPPKQ
jgi:outer membrane protein